MINKAEKTRVRVCVLFEKAKGKRDERVKMVYPFSIFFFSMGKIKSGIIFSLKKHHCFFFFFLIETRYKNISKKNIYIIEMYQICLAQVHDWLYLVSWVSASKIECPI
jgi:hypothetical protein